MMIARILAVALALHPPGPVAGWRRYLGEARPVGSLGHRRDLYIIENLRSIDEDIRLLRVLVGRGPILGLDLAGGCHPEVVFPAIPSRGRLRE